MEIAGSGGSHAPASSGNFVGLFAGDWATDEKTTFLAETFTIFSSLQKIAAGEEQRRANSQHANSLGRGTSAGALLPPVQTLQYYHRISNLYRSALRTYIQALETSIEASTDAGREISDETLKDLEVAQAIHTVLHFAESIYVPSDGRGAGVVGEEILHWLNSFDSGMSREATIVCAIAHVYYLYITHSSMDRYRSGHCSTRHPSSAFQLLGLHLARRLARLQLFSLVAAVVACRDARVTDIA